MGFRFNIPVPPPGLGALLVILPLVALVVAIIAEQAVGR